MINLFKKASVKAVEKALAKAGLQRDARQLRLGARSSAQAAARSLDTQPGAMVQAKVFLIGERPVLALYGGDNEVRAENLPRLFNLEGTVRACGRDETVAATGHEPGGVPPIPGAWPLKLPVAIDAGLKRFAMLYAPAGHPNWIVGLSVDELKRLTGGIVSYNVTVTPDHQGRIQRSGWRAA